MKQFTYYVYLLVSVLILSACNDKVEESWEVNNPQYLSYSDLRSSFKVAGRREIIQSGKLYFKDDFIFINEYREGIHVVDNKDPKDPKVIKFIEIPGNVDIAIADNILYADSYVDLLSIDISDIENIKVVDRDTNVFPYIIPEYEDGILGEVDESRGVIVGYKVETHTEEVDITQPYYQSFPVWNSRETMDVALMSSAAGDAGPTFGVGGSMARFTLYSNYLYAIDNSQLKLFNISDIENPEWEKSISISWNIETIFPYEQKLFIGSQTGMFIYSVQDPGMPEFISQFRHASACDPVVVDGNYAYVTLRGGNLCGAIESQLDVIDISNIEEPTLLTSYPMDEPYGLGIDDSVLFVCDGNSGLKIYNASDPYKISANQLAHYDNLMAFDVIPLGDRLLLIGIDGFYQYDYSDLSNIVELSHIPVYDK